jgi:hypothetical protein
MRTVAGSSAYFGTRSCGTRPIPACRRPSAVGWCARSPTGSMSGPTGGWFGSRAARWMSGSARVGSAPDSTPSPNGGPGAVRDAVRSNAPPGLAPRCRPGRRSRPRGDPARTGATPRWRPAWRPSGAAPAARHATAPSWPDTPTRRYGYRRMWKALLRAGETVGRDHVKRLMREHGIVGAKRRPVRPTPPRLPQAMPHELTDLIGILSRSCAPGQVAQVVRVQEPALEAILECLKDALPVHAGRFHPDPRDPDSASQALSAASPASAERSRKPGGDEHRIVIAAVPAVAPRPPAAGASPRVRLSPGGPTARRGAGCRPPAPPARSAAPAVR